MISFIVAGLRLAPAVIQARYIAQNYKTNKYKTNCNRTRAIYIYITYRSDEPDYLNSEVRTVAVHDSSFAGTCSEWESHRSVNTTQAIKSSVRKKGEYYAQLFHVAITSSRS